MAWLLLWCAATRQLADDVHVVSNDASPQALSGGDFDLKPVDNRRNRHNRTLDWLVMMLPESDVPPDLRGSKARQQHEPVQEAAAAMAAPQQNGKGKGPAAKSSGSAGASNDKQ
jgi:hypothetical protein